MRLSLGSVGFPGLWCPCPPRSSWSSCSPVGQSPWGIWGPLENFGHWWAQWSWSLMASPSSVYLSSVLVARPLESSPGRKGFATSQTWATFQTWPLVILCLLCSIHRARAFSMWSVFKATKALPARCYLYLPEKETETQKGTEVHVASGRAVGWI